MLQLELIVMLISLRSETNLLSLYLHLLLLHFLCMLLLLVKELRIVDYTTNRWLCIWRNLHEVYSFLASHIKGFACWHHFRSAFTHYSYFTYAYLFIYAILIFHFVILH